MEKLLSVGRLSRSRAFALASAALVALLVAGLEPAGAGAGSLLGIPATDPDGSPLDVGLLVLGHSTSAAGDWPAKLQAALAEDSVDGRNYVVFRNIVNGDGGFLWSRLSLPPGDLHYNRIRASQPQQFCQDPAGVRWSCRRLLIERSLGGADPSPGCCAAALPPAIGLCVWHQDGQRFEQANAPFLDCWRHMDLQVALVQDTSNRSWPVDDTSGDGQIGPDDYFASAAVASVAWPCGNTSGVIAGSIDWNCDGQIDQNDAADLNYSKWLEQLGDHLLDDFGSDGVEYVLLSAKPIEMGSCLDYPGEACCGGGSCDLRHLVRQPTGSRPFARFYLPTAYWEHESVALLADRPGVDSRIQRATPWSTEAMWQSSVACYQDGVPAGVWSLPTGSGQPASIVADDLETDGVNDNLLGCLGADHIHHNTNGGWAMADVWYQGVAHYLHPLDLFGDGFESGDLSAWSSVVP
jgi:hypothetical protein